MNYQSAPVLSETELEDALGETMRRVYIWMTLGLLVTFGAAAAVALSPTLINVILGNPLVFLGLVIGELVLVFTLSSMLMRLSPGIALAMFFAYALANGLVLSVIFLAYSISAIAVAFFATACMFAAMSLLGWTTKRNLSSFGSYLFVGLIGLIVASLVNMFLRSPMLDWIIAYAGVFIFLGLTVHDTQRTRNMLAAALVGSDQLMVERIHIISALSLYLDFINLFLFLLRILGRRR
jgi:hypothetical protein